MITQPAFSALNLVVEAVFVSSVMTMDVSPPFVRVVGSAALPCDMLRGSIAEAVISARAVAVRTRATPAFGPEDNALRFTAVASWLRVSHAARQLLWPADQPLWRQNAPLIAVYQISMMFCRTAIMRLCLRIVSTPVIRCQPSHGSLPTRHNVESAPCVDQLRSPACCGDHGGRYTAPAAAGPGLVVRGATRQR
jgi:hypothetical protein